MPSPAPLQCLFCHHLNPGGASFCNECGSQLQLQQCDLCGSINKRSARVCYKCGGAFALAPVFAGHLALDSDDGGDNANGIGREPATLPESAANALHALHPGGSDSAIHAAHDRGGEVVGQGAGSVLPRPELSPDDAGPGAPAGSGHLSAISPARRAVVLMALVLVLSMLAVSVYFYLGQQVPQAPPAGRALDAAGASAVSGGPALAAPAADEPTAKARATKNKSFRALGLDVDVSSGAQDINATVAPHPAPAKVCQEAVAALGLCSAVAKKE